MFLVKMSAQFSLVCTNMILMNPSSMNSWTKWYRMSMCFILWLVVMFLDMKMAPTLSTLTIIGNFTGIPIDIITWAMNFTSLATSDRASLEDRVTLL